MLLKNVSFFFHITIKSNTIFFILDRPNISNVTCNLKDARSVRLNCDVFLYDKSPPLQEVFWTKNKQKLDIQGSGGKFSGVTFDDPSLIINIVNQYDAGEYQLTATNSVGESKSDVIVLGKTHTHTHTLIVCIIVSVLLR